LRGTAHYLKLAADQGIAAAQNNSGNCLHNGEGVGIDFKGAAHYFKHAADPGIAIVQNNYEICLQKVNVLEFISKNQDNIVNLPQVKTMLQFSIATESLSSRAML
jgi:hypothetical protein